jgi:hypothetical protein
MVDTLTSRIFWGRGYTNDGMNKAARFIAEQMRSIGVKPMQGSGYLQQLTFPVNTFPGKMEVSINGRELQPGKDFIVSPDSRGVKVRGILEQKDSSHFVDPSNKVVVSLQKKLTWSVGRKQADYTNIIINKNAVGVVPINYRVNIESKFNEQFTTSNVCGIVKGTLQPDSIIVFTAHYDHLGGMGKDTYFPGANDNASGISLLLNLAKYYAANPPPYTVAFICFAGEEAGLVGSKYFTENPLLPLNKIRFLTNVDLVGTGVDGVTVVNATEFPKEFALLNKVNDGSKYVVKINARGKAPNSDHYWFTEKGVPAFFLYTSGGIAAYHDVFDKGSTLPMNEFNDVFKMIVEFNKGLMNSN